MKYTVKDFDYYLSNKLIAQEPAKPRDCSRLLLLNKKTGKIYHDYFYHLVDYLKKGDILVLNNSKVFPARLIGHKTGTGGEVEVFLHHQCDNSIWECLIGGRVKENLVIEFPSNLRATLLKNNIDGTWQVKFNLTGSKFLSVINKIGVVPLPPYIKRQNFKKSDKNDYQTVFANKHKTGSVAAPTAGLHFTLSLLKKIKEKGIKIEYVTLHVGLGTFSSVKTDNIEEHKMHREFVEVSVRTIRSIAQAKKHGARVVAVGTTSCRTLESVNFNSFKRQSFWTDIFIFPGYNFKIVDALVTNFHLPKSTLLMLISALAGKKNVDFAYQEAIKQKYRFFSYGDAMLIY